ncbi:MAG: AAA family ATPase [Candidatus Wallbacteria bacterium]|nr:AAA family ATPase [Candidatus Wallbacteria bacterium]
MYLKFFNLTRFPFHVTPDPEFIYLTSRHEEALNRLKFGIESNLGFIVLTGEIGSGKTTLIRKIIGELKGEYAFIFNPQDDFLKLMRQILDELEIIYAKSDDALELINKLNTHALDCLSQNLPLTVLIDEAQNLSIATLEKVRMLTNLETDKAKLVTVILTGQPELSKLLEEPALFQLKQRIGMRYHLKPLAYEDLAPYINHRLRVAGKQEVPAVVFTGSALRRIYSVSRGVPRLVNLICHQVLITAFTLEKKKITREMVTEISREFKLPGRLSDGIFQAVPLFLILLALVYFAGSREGCQSPARGSRPEAGANKKAEIINSPCVATLEAEVTLKISESQRPAAGSLIPQSAELQTGTTVEIPVKKELLIPYSETLVPLKLVEEKTVQTEVGKPVPDRPVIIAKTLESKKKEPPKPAVIQPVPRPQPAIPKEAGPLQADPIKLPVVYLKKTGDRVYFLPDELRPIRYLLITDESLGTAEIEGKGFEQDGGFYSREMDFYGNDGEQAKNIRIAGKNYRIVYKIDSTPPLIPKSILSKQGAEYLLIYPMQPARDFTIYLNNVKKTAAYFREYPGYAVRIPASALFQSSNEVRVVVSDRAGNSSTSTSSLFP